MKATYRNIMRAVLETPWAIEESYLAVIVEVLSLRLTGERFSDEELQARVGNGSKRTPGSSVNGGATAVIPIMGTIMPRADSFANLSQAGTSMQAFQRELAAAVKDPDVANILLEIDSPGGQVDLVPEAAADIRAARQSKPIVAIANTKAASAAYYLGSQATEFVVTPSGQVGSIGVFAAHDDLSKALEMQGVSTTLISAGKYKTETSSLGPLTDEARAAVQERVDAIYQQFTSDVAKGRRVPVDSVRNGFGEGRMMNAKMALREGMVDAIETLDATVARMAKGGGIIVKDPDAADDATGDPADAGARAGLQPASFSAALRRTLGDVDELVADARRLTDVRERNRLTGSKREQFRALADALGDVDEARSAIVALLEDTDPDRPDPDAVAIVAAHSARLAKTRGVSA